ncbi:MAG: hypothetical protein HFE45_07460 [Oscillospiraceae bacterium]|jgi:hypothetical protein|nr:hypothetical protein [Oscillospiraceae bacterium]
MKKAIFWIQILVIIVELFAVILLGLEIYGQMNPDKMIIEAIVIGVCLAINIVCAFCKLHTDKK